MLIERIKLEADEEVLRIVRKHWWVIFTRTAAVVMSILLPPLFLLFGRTFLPPEVMSLLAGQGYLLWFFYCLWLLFNWMWLANIWTDYYLDLWAITDRRIVSIDQRGFFHRFLSSFRLERLQDMNINVKGLIPTLLNFGTIEAQTAGGSNEEFKTDNMPDPRGLKALIINEADKRQRRPDTARVLEEQGL